MKTTKQSKTQKLCATIAICQDLIAAGAPTWDPDRNLRCEQEIRKAIAELASIMVSDYRAAKEVSK